MVKIFYKNKIRKRGLTLIEVIIYTVLLSLLMASFIQYASVIQNQNIKLFYEVQE